MEKKRVIVIGGGFAGSHVAKHLDRKFNVTLIDIKEYFEFTPGVLRTIVEPLHIRKIQVLHSHYLRWARVIVGMVDKIGDDFVSIGKKKLKFDYLVIASGSSYEVPFKEQVVTATRGEHLRDYYNALCKAKRVLIIGGGVVGVEMAGEICSQYKDKKIIIVHSKGKLIERNNKKAADYAENLLRRKGVEIYFNERVVGKRNGAWRTDKDRKLKTDLAFLCTGITPNFYFIDKKFLEKNGVKVNKHLQIKGKKNIFACGDVSNIIEEKTAQNAERQADVVYHNICSLEKGEKLCEYKSKRTPLVISLGKDKGIFSKGDFVLTGFLPAWMKFLVEKREMWKKRRVK